MNQIIIEKAKRKFKRHTFLYVYVKKGATVPYEKSYFHKIISDSKPPLRHKKYKLYIHDAYVSINSQGFLFEPLTIFIDDRLWIELYCVFNLEND